MRRYAIYLMVSVATFVLGAASIRILQIKSALLKLPQAESVPETDRKIIDPRWVYIHRDIKWRPQPLPPPEIISDWKEMNPEWDVSQWKELEANDRIVIFYPSGDYAEVLVALWEIADSHAIDFAPNGETSYHTHRGKWMENADGTISTIANYSHFGMYNRRSCSLPEVIKRNWIVRQPATDQLGALLETDGEAFVSASEIKDLDLLNAYVNYGEKEYLNDCVREPETGKRNRAGRRRHSSPAQSTRKMLGPAGRD